MENDQKKVVKIEYTNWRGETAIRTIVPKQVWFGNTQWHPEDGWLLDAFDVEKQEDRSFAMKDIQRWIEKEI